MLLRRSHIAQTHLPREGTAQSGRGPSTSTNNQDMAIGLSEPANASFKTPSQVTLHCVGGAMTTNQSSFHSAILLGGMADFELGSKCPEASGTSFSTRRLKKKEVFNQKPKLTQTCQEDTVNNWKNPQQRKLRKLKHQIKCNQIIIQPKAQILMSLYSHQEMSEEARGKCLFAWEL